MSTIKQIGKLRAEYNGKKYVIACGRLFGPATNLDGRKQRDPELDVICAANGIGLFEVKKDETCADALARYQNEYRAHRSNDDE